MTLKYSLYSSKCEGKIKSLLLLIVLSFFIYMLILNLLSVKDGNIYNRLDHNIFLPFTINDDGSDYCGNELMRYFLRIRSHGNLSDNLIKGRRFNCALTWLLDKYKLSDKYAIRNQIPLKRPGEHGFHFITAANTKYYPYLKTLLYKFKKQFDCRQRIIVYDLDGFSEDKTMPLNAVCGMELRKFNWSILPVEVTERTKIFAWKFIVFSQSFSEYDTWIWIDTSIVFHDPKLFEPIFVAIEKNEISELIMPGENAHGMRFATNPRMYNFLPFAPDWFPLIEEWEKIQWESNVFIVHKSEYSRKMLKWSLLCAATRECIEPTGSPLDSKCDIRFRNENGHCNRMDQSILTILTVNSEYDKLYNKGINFLPHPDARHPRKGLIDKKYEVRRNEKLNETDERIFIDIVNCCKKKLS